MPVESKKTRVKIDNVNMRESAEQAGAGSSNQTLEANLVHGLQNVNLATPSTESDIASPTPLTPQTPAEDSSSSSNSSSCSSNSSSSSSSSSPPYRRFVAAREPPPPPPVPVEEKYQFVASCPYIGATHGKRKIFTSEDSPRFEGAEVVQVAAISRDQAEMNIKDMEVKYGCDLSVKKIQADKMKAATNKATIERLEIELQVAHMKEMEYSSKEKIYKEATNMRLVARVLFIVCISLTCVNSWLRTSTLP